MTPTTIAETILRDVPRYASPDGNLLAEEHVLAALTAPTDAAHVNETPKSEHDAGNVLTDAALIARLREIQGQAGLFASAAADLITALLARIAAMEVQIKGLRAERDTVLGMYMRSSEEGFRQKAHAEAAETALAAMTKERDYADGTNEVLRGENQRLETALAAERSKVAKLVEALESIANDVDLMATGRTSLLGKMGRTARAAITEATQ